jgi:hypothetical protein
MDRKDEREIELEYAPKGMFPEDDEEDLFEIDIDEDLDVWNRGSSHTFGGGTGWWATGGIGSATALSSMWSTNYSDHSTAQRLLRHKKHIDSLCKVVDPTVKHTLEFASAGGSGYTDMTRGHIVIDGKLIKNNDTKLDVVSGLAIHEKLHVIHSNSLHRWQKSDEIYDLAPTYHEKKLLHNIANIVEDEYIERQLQKTCAGYVHYIEACKEHYFAESKVEEVDLTDFTELVNTLLLLVRYPSKLDADRRKKHGKHIRVFMAELKKGIDSRENTITCIKNIFTYLMKQAEDMTPDSTPTEEMLKDIDDSASTYAESYIEDFKRDVSPEAWEEMEADGKIDKIRDDISKRRARVMRTELEDKLRDKLRSLMGREYLDALDKAVKYKSDELSTRMQKQIKELEESDYYEEDIGKALAVTDGQRKITWQRALSDEYHKRNYTNAKIEMKSQINKLKKKIDLYGATNVHNIYNQRRGILDKRQLHKIPMGMTDLFKAKITKEDKPLDICLLVDESGSMGYSTMESARQSAIAIKEALADNPMINLWVYGHSADEKIKGQTEMIEYYSPTMKDRPFAMGGMSARYENRDGNAIIASAQRVKAESNNNANKLMIVLSDGQPSADLYRGSRGIEHTAKAVNFAESRGWSVIQVGFAGASKHYMSQMFTNHIYVDDVDTLGDNLSKIIRKVVKV